VKGEGRKVKGEGRALDLSIFTLRLSRSALRKNPISRLIRIINDADHFQIFNI
jgi:hypothetical protein